MGICFIIKVWKLSVSFALDTFYAEATGEYARQLPPEIDTTVCHSVQLQMNCRSYQDREGQTRYSNEIRIIKLC